MTYLFFTVAILAQAIFSALADYQPIIESNVVIAATFAAFTAASITAWLPSLPLRAVLWKKTAKAAGTSSQANREKKQTASHQAARTAAAVTTKASAISIQYN